MNNIKSLVITRFNILSILTVSMALSVILLMIRMKLTHSFFYLFLVWNLFLAIIPYVITTYLISKTKISKLTLVFSFCIWLIFLPNAPYIITDLMHLRLSSNTIIWLDALVVISFALNGLVLCFLSLLDMEKVLKKYLSKKTAFNIILSCMFLSGFGIYLGRFLRFNSWDIIQHPNALIQGIFNIIIHPEQHQTAWLFTISFGMFLCVSYWLFKALNKATI